MRPIEDPDGTIDFGNIDAFTREGNRYALEGEWGRVVIVSNSLPTARYL